jgi:hypothetical protein
MVDFPGEVWAAIGIISVVGVLGVLHSLATQIRNQIALHDTKVRVATLRQNYARQLAAASEPQAETDVIILPEPAARRAA